MEARDIIKRPVITERSSEILAEKKYTFEVDTRVGKFGGYTNKRRKAIVKLTADSKEIELFEI